MTKRSTLTEVGRLVLDVQVMGALSNAQGLEMVNRQLAIQKRNPISSKHYSKVKNQLLKLKEDRLHSVLKDKLMDNHDAIYELRLITRQMWGIVDTTKDDNLKLRTLAEIRDTRTLISTYHEENGEITKEATAEKEVLGELTN